MFQSQNLKRENNILEEKIALRTNQRWPNQLTILKYPVTVNSTKKMVYWENSPAGIATN
jgi:hypothetical protein